jgi:hypothetical protein
MIAAQVRHAKARKPGIRKSPHANVFRRTAVFNSLLRSARICRQLTFLQALSGSSLDHALLANAEQTRFPCFFPCSQGICADLLTPLTIIVGGPKKQERLHYEPTFDWQFGYRPH